MDEQNNGNGEHELVQAEQTEVTIRKFDDSGKVVSKTTTITTEYMQKINIENIGFYM